MSRNEEMKWPRTSPPPYKCFGVAFEIGESGKGKARDLDRLLRQRRFVSMVYQERCVVAQLPSRTEMDVALVVCAKDWSPLWTPAFVTVYHGDQAEDVYEKLIAEQGITPKDYSKHETKV